jgi:hypothetical protein
MKIKIRPNNSNFWRGYLMINPANTIAKNVAKRLMYNADITANL